MKAISITTPPAAQTQIVLDATLVAQVSDLALRAQGINVTDPATNEEAGLLLSETTKLEKALDEQRKAAKAPWMEVAKAVDAAAKPSAAILEKAKDALKAKMLGYAEAKEKEAQAASTDGVIVQAGSGTDFTALGTKLEYEIIGEPPRQYLMVDEKKVAAAVKAGILTAADTWLKIKAVKTIRSTGR